MPFIDEDLPFSSALCEEEKHLVILTHRYFPDNGTSWERTFIGPYLISYKQEKEDTMLAAGWKRITEAD